MASSSSGRISKDTAISIGLALALLAPLLWVVRGLDRVDHKIDLLAVRFGVLEVKVAKIESHDAILANDVWTVERMAQWVELLKARNGSLSVPDVRKVK